MFKRNEGGDVVLYPELEMDPYFVTLFVCINIKYRKTTKAARYVNSKVYFLNFIFLMFFLSVGIATRLPRQQDNGCGNSDETFLESCLCITRLLADITSKLIYKSHSNRH